MKLETVLLLNSNTKKQKKILKINRKITCFAYNFSLFQFNYLN